MDEAKPKAIRQLDESRFKPKEYVITDYAVVVEPGTTRAEMKNPAFWAHVAAKFNVYSQIHITSEDATFYARALVLQTDRTWAVVHFLEWHDLTTKDVAQTQAAAAELGASEDAFEIAHRGSIKKWTVIRKADRGVVSEGHAGKVDAMGWLADHLKTANSHP